MIKKWLFLLTLLVLIPLNIASAQDNDNVLSAQEIETIAAAVVRIETPMATGSGTIISADGLIFTNRHVIEDGGRDFEIYMQEAVGELPVLQYHASLIAVFNELDFAVLQIDRDANGRALDTATLSLPHIERFAERVSLADPVVIFGYPSIGDGYLVVTRGSVTSIENATIVGQRIPLWYRTDAQISPGNSGGLAVNLNGEFVGIPTEVRKEDDTLGRLGGLLAYPSIRTLIENNEGSEPSSQTETSDSAQVMVTNNATREVICGVYISPSTSSTWGNNLLEDVLRPGQNETWNITAGIYDVLLQNCDDQDILDLREQTIRGTLTISYPQGSTNGNSTNNGDSSRVLAIEFTDLQGDTQPRGATEPGLSVYANIEASGYRGEPLRVAAFFFWEDLSPISCENAPLNYCSARGYLMTEIVFTPDRDRALYEDVELWLPMSAFPEGLRGRQNGFAIAAIGTVEGDLELVDSTVEFTITYR